MSQSPWNEAHGKVSDSVQTLILKELAPLYQADEAKFVGSVCIIVITIILWKCVFCF